ncbi:hypothetical protein TREAZ_0309 [Leadbettera azotonutricia ZAS-9]|uniref:Uncharacterized protein n=1 Tax=Leadbettera azotonutricia (strain ATCC BAA-888 / DSM 13862 / ZAS-9) TaxID=545695 RepID=F5YDL3_LEAAZ|nr:hypothetical protein TREAZ_0309 [Leadbettera azotonutricia ZAS-9]
MIEIANIAYAYLKKMKKVLPKKFIYNQILRIFQTARKYLL